MRNTRRMIFIILNCCAMNTPAIPLDYYDTHAKGWHWYEAMPDTKEKPVESVSPLTLDNATIAMSRVQKKVEAAKALAILDPTPQNVHYYLALQNQVSDRASLFAATWKQVLLEDPRLDENLKHPTNALGRQVSLDRHKDELGVDIQTFAQHSGLFFFYKGQCPYCHQFAPILKAFTQKMGIAVVPISLDGHLLAQFPDTQLDQGQGSLFSVHVVPALFAVDPKTHQAIPVGYGLMSEEELEERVAHIATQWEGVQS